MTYKTLLVDETDGVVFVTLNRPDVHNAFNDELISEAIDLFESLARVIPSDPERSEGESRDPHRKRQEIPRLAALARDDTYSSSPRYTTELRSVSCSTTSYSAPSRMAGASSCQKRRARFSAVGITPRRKSTSSFRFL